jgi:O-antigen/teichoic acid export membrane protein
MYGKQFEPAIGTAAVLVSVAAIGATASAGSSLVYAAERSSFILLCGIVGAAAVVACGLTIIPRFGTAGAAWSRAGIQVLMVIWGMWYIAKRLHYKPPVVSLLKTTLAAVACGAEVLGVTWYWRSPLALLLAIAAAAVTYLAAALAMRSLEPQDTRALWQIASRSGRLFARPGFANRGGDEGIL